MYISCTISFSLSLIISSQILYNFSPFLSATNFYNFSLSYDFFTISCCIFSPVLPLQIPIDFCFFFFRHTFIYSVLHIIHKLSRFCMLQIFANRIFLHFHQILRLLLTHHHPILYLSAMILLRFCNILSDYQKHTKM